MATPPHDPNNPYNYSGQEGAGGYPQFPSGPGGPGGPQGYTPAGAPPPNYLAFGIITTILCCLPLGIGSIVYATQVNNKWQMGDFEGARKASQNAKSFAIWSVVATAIIYVVLVALMLGGVIALDDF